MRVSTGADPLVQRQGDAERGAPPHGADSGSAVPEAGPGQIVPRFTDARGGSSGEADGVGGASAEPDTLPGVSIGTHGVVPERDGEKSLALWAFSADEGVGRPDCPRTPRFFAVQPPAVRRWFGGHGGSRPFGCP